MQCHEDIRESSTRVTRTRILAVARGIALDSISELTVGARLDTRSTTPVTDYVLPVC